jgi:hypothetical protein
VTHDARDDDRRRTARRTSAAAKRRRSPWATERRIINVIVAHVEIVVGSHFERILRICNRPS